ncbi:MAG TPA: 2Fe-2S iron-sulfur cluster-binding protein, partial [Anaerolineae bacterium]|nr:2Fe-2S iron-sulfur cluster-binding protein [Anaerolineae bacterium]
MPRVRFAPAGREIEAAKGWTILEAAQACGVEINIPCGGQGRCGRCAVVVEGGDGSVRRRSTMRLSAADIAAGYALACQSVVAGELAIAVPPQEEIARHLVSEKTAITIAPPAGYNVLDQPLQALFLALDPPDLGDQTDDWSRVQAELSRGYGMEGLTTDLSLLRGLGAALRAADWEVTAIVETDAWDRPDGPPRLIDVLPGRQTDALHAVAIDIGTTTISLYLVDLMSGQVVARSADYNAQISRGEDVISRIVYASQRPKVANLRQVGNLAELQRLVAGTINKLIQQVCRRASIDPQQIYKAVVAGNPTMMHLFLGIPPEAIRLAPYIPTVNHTPSLNGGAAG